MPRTMGHAEPRDAVATGLALQGPGAPVGSRGSGDASAPCRVSIIIKAYNESAHIAAAVRSAQRAVQEIGGDGEVIVADSLSTDDTVTVALTQGARVVQLLNPGDRSCGVGAQLGLCCARGAFLYVLDGDMELVPGFLPLALRYLEATPALAGVAGLVQEMVVANLPFEARVAKGDTARPAADARSLNMGGLYRRTCIEPLGYFTNRNLHAFEEFELGVRLRARGWRLERLAVPAVRHHGPKDTSWALLRRRWSSGYAMGHGELLRQSFGQAHFVPVLLELRVYRVQAFTALVWSLCLFAGIARGGGTAWWAIPLIGWAGVVAILALARSSLSLAWHSVLAWHVGLAALLVGLWRRPLARPQDPVACRLRLPLQDAAASLQATTELV
jgi:glycosyltransferase involved in cell wall biosynthesis